MDNPNKYQYNSACVIKSVIQSKRNRLKDDSVFKCDGDLVNVDNGEVKVELGYLKVTENDK